MELQTKIVGSTSNPDRVRSMDSMNFHIWVWKYCGIWPPNEPTTSSLSKFTYHLFMKLLYGIFLVVFSSCMVLNLIFVENLAGVIETLFICSTCVMCTVKGICIMSKLSTIRQLFAVVDEMDRFVVSAEQQALIRVSHKESRRLLQMLGCLYYCGVTSAFVLSVMGTGELMWPSWFPGIPWQESTTWLWSMRSYQFLCSLVVAFLDSSVDMYGAALSKLLGAHLDVLAMRLSDIGRAEGGNSMSEIPLKWEKELNECVKYHNLCIKFAQLMDDIFSLHYFIQFACSGLIICVSAYKLSEIQPLVEMSEFIFLCEYLFSMTLEIFIPCYFGSVVTTKSEQLSHSLFQSNWVEQSGRFHSSMRIFVERSLRPIRPMASGIVLIGLPTFVAILRAAYSLLSLLKSIEK